MDYIPLITLRNFLENMPKPRGCEFVDENVLMPLPDTIKDITIENILKREELLSSSRKIWENYGIIGDYKIRAFRTIKWFSNKKIINLYNTGDIIVEEYLPKKEFNKKYSLLSKKGIIKNNKILFASEDVYKKYNFDDFNGKVIISFLKDTNNLPDYAVNLIKKVSQEAYFIFKVENPCD